jgi:Skp family chaperone for outer membrane proteins
MSDQVKLDNLKNKRSRLLENPPGPGDDPEFDSELTALNNEIDALEAKLKGSSRRRRTKRRSHKKRTRRHRR